MTKNMTGIIPEHRRQAMKPRTSLHTIPDNRRDHIPDSQTSLANNRDLNDEHRQILASKDRLDRINLDQSYTNDPVEQMVGDALTAAGYAFEYETHPNRHHEIKPNTPILDFKVLDGPYIEVKRFATARSAVQLEVAPDVILIQGIEAARWFAAALQPKK